MAIDDSLFQIAKNVGSLLVEQHHKLVAAESCTGGWVSQCVTSVAGSSEWFDCGFVTYSNQAKREMLGVSGATLEQFGAVSEETVGEMAVGALRNSDGQCAVAITGVAGPGGGSPEKPVGTVWLAWQLEGSSLRTQRADLKGNRFNIRRQAVVMALAGVVELYR